VAISSCEAEYISLKEATKEALYLNNMFTHINNALNLGYYNNTPIILIDNKGAKQLAENPEFHKRSKHIDITYHFTRQAINNNNIILYYIHTQYNLADWLTKAVNNPHHKQLLQLANITDSESYNNNNNNRNNKDNILNIEYKKVNNLYNN
jgi:hypothetical protein